MVMAFGPGGGRDRSQPSTEEEDRRRWTLIPRRWNISLNQLKWLKLILRIGIGAIRRQAWDRSRRTFLCRAGN